MNNTPPERNRRVLIIDDNRAIHEDFRKILCPASDTAAALDATEAALFGYSIDTVTQTQFEVDSAYQGRDGVLLAAKALEAGRPYALAFVDVRMPPGWDGVETTGKLWELDPNLQIVICTAYSDYSWGEMFEQLGQRDGLLILKKPFDSVEAFQMAHALTEKWWLYQQSRRKVEGLESRVAERTAELAKSETLYHSLVENVPQHIFRKDRAGRFTFGNNLFCLGLGKPLAGILGRTDLDFFQAPIAAKYRQDDQRVVESGQPFEADEENPQADGSTNFVHVIKTPLRDDGGLIIGIQGISWDVTGRKRAEETLRESEDRYRLLVEESPDAIGIYQDAKLVFVNSTGIRLMNARTAEELLGRKSEQIIHPDDLTDANDRVRRRLAGERGVYPAEVRYVRLDGTTVPVEVSAAPIILNGKPAMQFIARDITERRREEAIRETLLSLAARLSEARTSKDVAQGIFTVAERLWQWDAGTFDLWSPADDVARTVMCVDLVGGERREVPPIGTPGVPTPLMRRILAQGAELVRRPQPMVLAAEFTKFGDTSRQSATLMYVLIRRHGQPVGMLSIQSYTPDAFTGEDLQTLQGLADHCGGALERIEVEGALRESEERFSGAFEYAPIGMALVSPEGHWLRVNRALCDLVGYTETELLSRTFQEITHPEDLGDDLANVRRMIAGEIHFYQIEKRYLHKLRHFVTVLLNVSLVRDGQGQPRYFISQIQDISARKQAENALRESNEKFLQLADNITDAFWIRSPDLSEVHYLSPAFEQIWGRSRESLYANPKQWADFILPEDRERVLDAFAALTGEVPSLDIEYRIVRPGGEIRWVRVRGFQVRDAAGKLIRHTGIVADITERKRNEISALAYSKLGFRLNSVTSAREAFNIIKEVSQELFGWDAFCIRLYSAQSESFYSGFTIDTIAGQPVEAERGGPEKPGELYRRVIARGGELILRDRPAFDPAMAPFGDVSRPSAVLMFVPIRSRGQVVGVLSVQSYTPNAYNELDLQTLQTMADQCGGAIERIWAEEALHKTEARLFQSQKLETVGKLAGGVAHEFNSILTAIIGQSELLLGDLPAGSPLVKNATEIGKAANRAAKLTRQLLAYGRRTFLRPELLDLNQIIAGMEDTIRHLLGGEVDLRFIPAEGLRAVEVDAGQIEQVIMNLVMNAADSMSGGGKLTLETAHVSFDQESVGRYPELKPGDYVMLAVTDTGTGMGEEVKARAFEPFFTTKGVGEGAGLGLSTSYGIVKQSGGHISVYSEPGRGTTFKIYLPQVESPRKIPLQRLDSPDLPRGTETILLVEDDPALREMAAALLSRLGYKVLAAANGIEALNLKQQRTSGHVDLLFTDVVMPHMSGRELADRVRAFSPHTRILFTSAYAENAIIHQGVLNKGVLLLLKPFTPSALARKVREVLDQPRAPEPDPAQKSFGFTEITAAVNPPGN